MTTLTDAELARLEARVNQGEPFHREEFRREMKAAVPSLVAEVRRLRDAIDTNAMLYMDVTTVCPDCTMQGGN